MMPISEIGKAGDFQAGHTLLEILAVFILIGIIGSLALPLLNVGEERAYVHGIGKLIQADLSSVRQEAVSEKSPIAVEFSQNGYFFNIGEIELRRTFDKYRFTWIPTPVTAEGAVESSEEETENEAGLQPLEISYNTGGVFPETLLQWETIHFRGELSLTPEGSVNWRYGTK